MSDHLMTSRRFAPLFWTQFLSAFNDNFLKNTLVFLILFRLAADEAASLVSLSGAIFIAPFLLLSALGGELADRFDKAAMARIAEARRDCGRRALGRRHRAIVDPGVAVRAVYLRRHRGAVRSGEIRHPARSSRAQGTAAAPMRGSSAAPSAPSLAARSSAASSPRKASASPIRAADDGAGRSAAGWSAATSRRPARPLRTLSSTRTYSARPGVSSANCGASHASGSPR